MEPCAEAELDRIVPPGEGVARSEDERSIGGESLGGSERCEGGKGMFVPTSDLRRL
jgi:hypothetical protein